MFGIKFIKAQPTTYPLQTKNEPRQPGVYERTVAGFKWDSDYLYFTVREPFPAMAAQ